MNAKVFPFLYVLWLVFSVPSLMWFDRVAVDALFSVSLDGGGNVVFKSGDTVVYPFTYVAALLSFVGVVYYVLGAERRVLMLPVALLAARASTIGVINLYEQVFTGFGSLVWSENVWLQHYGRDFETLLWTFSHVLWVFAVAPWMTKENIEKVLAVLAVFAVLMLLWMTIGLSPPSSGPVAYMLNAVTRILPHLALVYCVKPASKKSRG